MAPTTDTSAETDSSSATDTSAETDFSSPTVAYEIDPIAGGAKDLAHAAATEVAPAGHVGDSLGLTAEGEHVVTHYFACFAPAYVGWRWAVTVVRAPDAETVTVDEVVLLPGEGALLPPAWLPWEQRIAPGDLGVGDLLPTLPDDERLEAGWSGSDALEEADGPRGWLGLRPEQWEAGLGRSRVLSRWGREDAAMRWHEGDFGPDAPMAQAAPAHCNSCGFLVPIGGGLGQVFGLCANALAPADGRVVDLRYGCGAHSSVPPFEGTSIPITDPLLDVELETVDLEQGTVAAEPDVVDSVDSVG